MAMQYQDLYNLKEDERIDYIVHAITVPVKTEKPVTVAFVVEDDPKADRYIEKLKAKCPGIRILDRFYGPAAGMVSVRVGGPTN
jgi:hypothetical protein